VPDKKYNIVYHTINSAASHPTQQKIHIISLLHPRPLPFNHATSTNKPQWPAMHRGRILLHERDTDDSTPTVSGGTLSAEHQVVIFVTEDQGMSDAVRKDHRSRLRRIIKWLQEHYPDVSDQSVRVVTIEEKANSRLYYYPLDQYDLVYHLKECQRGWQVLLPITHKQVL
jgi:hypothetical protein